MTAVTFIQPNGTEITVQSQPGLSVMRAALDHAVPGILADCGGAMACATCHVHVDPVWFDRVGPPSEAEQQMLELAAEPDATSRLSCQILLNEPLDGVRIRVPSSQF